MSSATSVQSLQSRLLELLLFTLPGVLLIALSYLLSLPALVMSISRLVLGLGSLAYALNKRSLTTSILVSMVVGVLFGLEFPAQATELRLLSQIFLKLIKTIIAPLLFATLVVGIAGHSDIKAVGRMGLKAFIYFEIVTTLALLVGLAAINLTQAGAGVQPPAVMEEAGIEGRSQSLSQVILHIFPENIAQSVAEGEVLQIVVFSILFGVALAMVPEAHKRPILKLCESLAEVMFKFTGIVMLYAPIGVGAAIAYTVGHMGIDILFNLAKLLGTLYIALIVFILLVLVPAARIARVPIRRFASAVATPVSIAFATTSSEAALPKAMEAMEDMGCPRQVVAFVMPTGYSFNLDGTTLYLALASVFVAQAANIPMGWQEQLLMVVTLMVTSKGVAGVPRASLVILLGTAASFGLPEWPILAILGIDELMDMARTSVNVIGNCLATLVVGRWEGVYNPDALPIVKPNILDEPEPTTSAHVDLSESPFTE